MKSFIVEKKYILFPISMDAMQNSSNLDKE